MKILKAEVRSQFVRVGVAEYPQYATVAEAIEHEGEENLLKVITTALRTRKMLEVRATVYKERVKLLESNTGVEE